MSRTAGVKVKGWFGCCASSPEARFEYCGGSQHLEQLQVLRKASVRLALKREIILFYRLSLKSGGRTEQMFFTWRSV